MKQEHKYAQVLRWIADGESIQVKLSVWVECSHEGALRHILGGRDKFRLSPKTIKIGKREVEAPLVSVKDGEFVHSIHHIPGFSFNGARGDHCSELSKGRLFSSEKAALDFDDAITALVLEQCK